MKHVGIRILGLFILVAAALSAGAVFLFGSRDVLKPKNHFVAYFEQSVNGLNVGAPVKFRGIEIGIVQTIEGTYNADTGIVLPRLTLETYPETLVNVMSKSEDYALFESLVANGMRASLKSQSILTGQLYVALDFYDDRPVRRLGHSSDPYPEMPTFDSGLGELFEAFEDLPLDALVTQFTSTLSALEILLTNDGIKQSADFLPQLLTDIDAAVLAISAFAGNDLPVTSKQLRSFLVSSEASITQLSDKLTLETLVDLEETFHQLNLTLELARTRLDPNDPISYELTNALREVSRAAASLRMLTDFLEEHPEALIRGRSQ